MSFQDIIQNYWQTFIIAPVAFVSIKLFSINSKVSVHESKINSLETAIKNLCAKHDTTNDLLRDIQGQLKEHLRRSG